LHADPCHTGLTYDVDKGHNWEENVLLKNAFQALQHTAES